MKWLNYHHLIYFREIARLGSIAKASESLKVGQPALSSQLKTLEEYLEVKLFNRVNRGLELTEAGKVALEYANKIADLGQELLQVIHEKTFTQRIQLRVGASDAVPKHLVSDIVDLAHKKTDCFLSITEGDPDYLMRELNARNIDLIITDQNVSAYSSDKTLAKQILKLKVSVFGTPEFSKLKKGFPKSLSGAQCIIPTVHSRLRADLEHFFHINKIHIDKVAETQDSMLQKILASKGDGLVFFPDFAVKEYVTNNQIIKIGTLTNVYVEYFLIYSKRIIGNPAVDSLLKQDLKKLKIGKI